MSRQNAFGSMCKVLAVATGVGIANFFYALWLIGASANGYIFALTTTLMLSSISVLGGVVMCLE